MTWDDSSISDEEVLLRRTRPLNNCIGRDSLTKRYYPLPGALTVDKDGMSVYRRMLLEAQALPDTAICKHPDHWIFAFSALCVRSKLWGVQHDNDEEDDQVGFAHSLVLTKSMPPTKPEKMLLREVIAEMASVAHMPPDHEHQGIIKET